jgi:uncharacterized iron-regulated membrane protein
MCGRTVVVPARRLRQSVRRWSDLIHRCLAFTVGAILIIAGLTGTLLAFYVEIERGLYPHMQTAHRRAFPASYEAVYRRLAELPPIAPPGGTWSIEIPPDGGAITSRRYQNSVSETQVIPTRMVTVDPVTFDVLRDAYWNDTFFTWIYDLHMYLQVGATTTIGQAGMGIAALFMCVMLMGGLANWLLPPGGPRAKLRVKWRGVTRARRTYDLHKLFGGSWVLMLLLTVSTGALISLPNQVRPVLNAFSTLKPLVPDVRSVPLPGAERLAIDELLPKATQRFPGARVVWVHVPTLPDQPYDLEIRQAGAPMTRFPRTHLYLDQYTGGVLAVYDPKTDGVGDTVLNWLVPLHDGKAFGMVGRVLVMLMGLVPSVMMVTGFMRWRQKRTAWKAAARQRANHDPS